MRISDWSSDVCSSDLQRTVIHHAQLTEHIPAADPVIRQTVEALGQATPGGAQGALQRGALMLDHMIAQQAAQIGFNEIFHLLGILFIVVRSEEHTSELQSLMRISYAVFCLKKKKTDSNMKQNCDTAQAQSQVRHIR